MNLYDKYVLPRLIDLVMRGAADTAERARLVPRARGTVLEAGIGSGLNARFYGPAVKRVYGLDPSWELWKIGRGRLESAPVPVTFLAGSAERIPLDDSVVDSVVMTWTLCSIPDAERALRDMKRVLKPDGQLLFIEHGRSPDPNVAAWQDRLNPLWRRVSGGCNLNRKMDELIVRAGFEPAELETGYNRGPRPFVYLYKGVARPRS